MNTLIGIQYLRGFAALGVVLFHLGVRYHFDFHIGSAGVDVFFVISGFVMWISTCNRKMTRRRFLWLRVRRIVPLYWLVTVVTFLLALIKPQFFGHIAGYANELLRSLLFVPYNRADGGGFPVVMQGWTLNVEMFFYVVFALTLTLRPMSRLAWPSLILAGLALAGMPVGPDQPVLYNWTHPLLIELAAGLWLGHWYVQGKLKHAMLGKLALVAGVLAFAWLQTYSIEAKGWRVIMIGVPAWLVVAGVVMIESEKALPPLFLLALLGDASYSVYLWHDLVMIVLDAARLRLHAEVTLGSIIAIGGLTVVASVVAYRFIELPMDRYLRTHKRTALAG